MLTAQATAYTGQLLRGGTAYTLHASLCCRSRLLCMSTQAPTRLRVDGAQIRHPDGTPALLRGFNLMVRRSAILAPHTIPEPQHTCTA